MTTLVVTRLFYHTSQNLNTLLSHLLIPKCRKKKKQNGVIYFHLKRIITHKILQCTKTVVVKLIFDGHKYDYLFSGEIIHTHKFWI